MLPLKNTSLAVVAGCPADEDLQELLGGACEESDSSLVSHLDGCRHCRDRLEALAAGEDLWSRATKNLRESTTDSFQELGHVMARVRTLTLGADDTLAPCKPDVSLAFLTPCETPGRLGRLGPYEVVDVLGRGGMGVVLKAVDAALDRTIAIKVLACPSSLHPEARARFRREARAVAAVRSEHAVGIHCVEENAEPPYLVMEYVPGVSLQQRIDRGQPLAIDEILRIGAQVARGLEAAHAQGLIHRDIKPANILLEAGTGKVKITDFGLARAVDAPSLTQSGTVTGTPEYMAPEQADSRPIDHRADLFSLGSVLYAMCTGHPPFRCERSLAVLRRTLEESPLPIRLVRPETPEALVRVIEKLHQKHPDGRYASAADVAEALEQLRATGEPAIPPTPAIRAAKATEDAALSRHLRWALLAASLVLAAMLAASELAGFTGIASRAVALRGLRTSEDAALAQAEPRAAGAKDRKPAEPRTRALVAAAAELTRRAPDGADPQAVAGPGAQTPLELTQPLRRFEGHTGPVASMALAPDGKLAISSSGWPQGDCTVRLWDVAKGKEIRRLRADELAMPRDEKNSEVPGEVYSVAFSPDGSMALFAGANGLFGLWDVRTGDVVRRFEGHKTSVYSVAFSPDGKQALSGGQDMTVRLWDVGTGKEIQRLTAHTQWVNCVAFAPDGNRALSGSRDQTMRLWDVVKGEQLREFKEHKAWVWGVSFAPDGLQALSAADTIRLWDLSDGRLLRTFAGHRGAVTAVTFSRDGRRFLSGGFDHTTRLWDRQAGREIATLLNHRDFVKAVAFSRDGSHALSAGGGEGGRAPFQPGNDFAIRLWKLP